MIIVYLTCVFQLCSCVCRMQSILGYQPEDLLDRSLYDFHHAGDSASLLGSFKSGKCQPDGIMASESARRAAAAQINHPPRTEWRARNYMSTAPCSAALARKFATLSPKDVLCLVWCASFAHTARCIQIARHTHMPGRQDVCTRSSGRLKLQQVVDRCSGGRAHTRADILA